LELHIGWRDQWKAEVVCGSCCWSFAAYVEAARRMRDKLVIVFLHLVHGFAVACLWHEFRVAVTRSMRREVRAATMTSNK
jgi:hypothetical protein